MGIQIIPVNCEFPWLEIPDHNIAAAAAAMKPWLQKTFPLLLCIAQARSLTLLLPLTEFHNKIIM
jgi:hypothetical protein